MARQLIYGNEVLSFTPATGEIKVIGHVPLPRLLLINNATINTTLYNFSDPNTTATCDYDPVSNTTVINVSINTSSMSANDKLQVYYEKGELEIKPSRTYRDPVSKLRVSNPQTLIDTDFEYGVQPTKWETLKLVNNIPTSYVSQTSEQGLIINKITAISGSDLVTVRTTSPHNLIPGSIVEITGLTDSQYEGTYQVKTISDSRTFLYKIPFKSLQTKDLQTIYSVSYPGAFYTGSAIRVAELSTDASTVDLTTGIGSKLTVTTEYAHGFNPKTKVYLKKSRATRQFTSQSPRDIVGTATTTNRSQITTLTSPLTEYYNNSSIIFDDFLGDWEVQLATSDFANLTGAMTISYNKTQQIGTASSISLRTGDVVMFYTPNGNIPPNQGNITEYDSMIKYTFQPFYVFNATESNNVVSFQISATWNSATPFTFTSAGTNTYGRHRMVKGYRINTITQAEVCGVATGSPRTASFGHDFNLNDEIIICNRGIGQDTQQNVVYSRNNGSRDQVFGDRYQIYTVTGTPNQTAGTFTIGGLFLGGTGTLTLSGSSTLAAVFKIKRHPLSNGLYLPPQAGFSTARFYDGQLVRYTGTQNTGSNISVASSIRPLDYNQRYLVKTITGYQNWYRVYPTTNLNLDTNVGIFVSTTNPGNVFSGSQTHIFQSITEAANSHSIALLSPPRGGLADNEEIIYSAAVTAVGGLNLNQSYKVKANDGNLTAIQFRLSNVVGVATISSLNYNANATTATIVIRSDAAQGTSLTDIGIENRVTPNGKLVQISGVTGTPSENLFWNRLHRIVSVGATSGSGVNATVTLTVDVPPTNEFRNIVNPYSIPAAQFATKLSGAKLCGIVSFTSVGGIGSHYISQNIDGAADDIYTIDQASHTSFIFDTPFEIPFITKSATNAEVYQTTNSIKLINHNFADGTAVAYQTTASPAIPPLVSGRTYFIRVFDRDFVGLCTSAADAIDRDVPVLDITGSGGVGVHNFVTSSVKGFITGSGTVAISSASNIAIGDTQTKFLSDFTTGDIFRVYTLNPSGTGPGTYFESKVTSIKSDRVLKFEQTPVEVGVPGIANTVARYFVPTAVYMISDGKIVHRPFDGGVNMTSGLIPNSKIVRQTRKYFRYQSGKGIQVSMAVNFNPTFDIDRIEPVSGNNLLYNLNCKFPHQISRNAVNSSQRVKIRNVTGAGATVFDGVTEFPIVGFPINAPDSDFVFTIQTPRPIASVDTIGGFPQYTLTNWVDCSIKAGLFDDQNGFFFEYDGTTLYAVRRSATQQISGQVTVSRGSQRVTGVDTLFVRQLSENDSVVIRGQTYKVIKVVDDSNMDVQPAYRGNTTSDIIISKVIDTKVPQSQWNLDKMDGTGESGYKLDINKIQMIYMDYSWYGAGTIRFGFKDTIGEVRYCHEFYHNNVFTESYMRSGNVPARYEVETFNEPLFSPSLFHWGCSVIMDGRFDDDKAYLFTADSKALPFTNGGATAAFSGIGTAGGTLLTQISSAEFNSGITVGETIIQSTGATNTIEPGTLVEAIEVDASSKFGTDPNYRLTVSKPFKTNTASVSLNCVSGTGDSLKTFVPLVSIRLAPSVDNATTGNLGFRDIINRMQLTLKSAGVLATHDCEVKLILNPLLSNDDFTSVGSPSLSQIYRHSVGDTFAGGTTVLAFRAQGGSVLNLNTGRRAFNVTDITLDEIALLGNSILGGDGVYPDGPDVLTLAVKPVDTSQIRGSAPFVCTGRITWAESQA
jgi:hypothetical protein